MRTGVLLRAIGALFLIGAAPAGALTINANNVAQALGMQADGSSVSVNPGLSATLSASVGEIVVMNPDGNLVSIGAGSGFEQDEVDILDQTLDVDFGGDVVITQITLGRLFGPDVAGDAVAEGALIAANGGSPETASADGSWTGLGTFQQLAGHGVWQILNPFGSTTIDSLSFSAQRFAGIAGSANSDFSIVSITYLSAAEVPEPTTALLLGVGLVGLASQARRGAGGASR